MPNKQYWREAVEQLDPATLEHYAQTTGWRKVENIPDAVALYRRPESELDEILIPKDRSFADFSRQMASVVQFLAEFEDRSVLAVLNDILLPPSDVVRFILEGDETREATIRLSEGLSFFEGAKKALLASACSVIRPRPFHQRMSLAEADTFVETCRLGIEPGSFTAVLICPLTPDSSYQPVLSPEFAGEPFARKVTKLLIQSTSLIVESIERGSLDRFLSPSEDFIVSANLCDALLGMKLSGKSAQLRITPAWSQKYPVPTELAAQTVVIKAEYLAEIEQLSQRLRPQRQSQKEWIIGWVETLNGEPGTDGAMQGEVTVSGFTESSDYIRGKIYLSAADYANAGEAHLNNWPVQIHGQVERARRTYLITEYDRFGVLTEE